MLVNNEYYYDDADVTAILLSRLEQEIAGPGELGKDGRIQVITTVYSCTPYELEESLSENIAKYRGERVRWRIQL